MKEKIKKILRAIFTIIAIIWIFGELTDSWGGPDLTVIIGVLIMWGIIIYSLRAEKQSDEKRDIKFCHNSGAKLQEDAIFCNQCGEKIKS
jgi:4-hydroxybenzoate polyprenyltransferase